MIKDVSYSVGSNNKHLRSATVKKGISNYHSMLVKYDKSNHGSETIPEI